MMDAPVTIVTDWITNKIQSGAADILADYISAAPIMIGVAIGVYALLNMISSKLANIGCVGVFLYGGIIVLI